MEMRGGVKMEEMETTSENNPRQVKGLRKIHGKLLWSPVASEQEFSQTGNAKRKEVKKMAKAKMGKAERTKQRKADRSAISDLLKKIKAKNPEKKVHRLTVIKNALQAYSKQK